MELQEAANKLKEIIFTKQGTGQPFRKLERALSATEAQILEAEAITKEQSKIIEEAENKFNAAHETALTLKRKLTEIAKEWQGTAVELFRAEREAENLYDEKNGLRRKAGMDSDKKPYSHSFHIGSQRVRWTEGEVDPISENFRFKLISDNREYYQKNRKERVRLPKPDQGPKFIPEQYDSFIAYGIQPPAWMEEAHKKHMKAVKEVKETKK